MTFLSLCKLRNMMSTSGLTAVKSMFGVDKITILNHGQGLRTYYRVEDFSFFYEHSQVRVSKASMVLLAGN